MYLPFIGTYDTCLISLRSLFQPITEEVEFHSTWETELNYAKTPVFFNKKEKGEEEK